MYGIESSKSVESGRSSSTTHDHDHDHHDGGRVKRSLGVSDNLTRFWKKMEVKYGVQVDDIYLEALWIDIRGHVEREKKSMTTQTPPRTTTTTATSPNASKLTQNKNHRDRLVEEKQKLLGDYVEPEAQKLHRPNPFQDKILNPFQDKRSNPFQDKILNPFQDKRPNPFQDKRSIIDTSILRPQEPATTTPKTINTTPTTTTTTTTSGTTTKTRTTTKGRKPIRDKNFVFMKWAYFVIIATTTIGYGRVYPKTDQGKLFYIFFSIIGIALMMTLLRSCGKILMTGNKKFYTWVCRGVCKVGPYSK